MPAPVLERFASGDTAYIGKHNTNATNIETALRELFTRTEAWDETGPARTFVALTDTPESYSGQAGKLVVVNATADGIAFAAAGAPSAFTGLSDAPGTILAGQFVRGNAGGSALEMVEIEPNMLSWLPSFVGQANRLLSINATEDGVVAATAFAPSSIKGLDDVAIETFDGQAGSPVVVDAAGEFLTLGTPIPHNSFELLDMPADLTGHAGHVLRVRSDEAGYELVAGGAGVAAFADLTDGPGAYTGHQYAIPMVNPGETGLMWAPLPPPSAFVGLSDVWEDASAETRLTSYTGHGGKSFRVAADGAGIELTDGVFAASGDITAAIAAHVAAPDPHPQYTTQAEMTEALAAVVQTPGGSFLESGGSVIWVSGYTFAVQAASYYLAGVRYASAAASITLGVADPDYDRIDVIVVDAAGDASAIAGTPGAVAIEPDIDETTQIKLAAILVSAASSLPANVSTEWIYRENAEWSMSTSSPHWDVASTSDHYAGSVCIEATGAVTGDYVTAESPDPFDPYQHEYLVLRIKSKGPTSGGGSSVLRITPINDAGARIGGVGIWQGKFGFDVHNTTDWQLLAIPVEAFGIPVGTLISALRFGAPGNAAAPRTMGMYLDEIMFQSGTGLTSRWAPHAPTHGKGARDELALDASQIISGELGVDRIPALPYETSGAVAAHEADTDPHPQYLQSVPAQPYVMGFFFPGAPTASQIIGVHVVTESVALSAALAGSHGYAGIAATAQTDIAVQHNGASAGTVRFAAAGSTPSFIAASPVSLVAGDRIALIGPATPDATLADLAVSIRGTR